MEKLTNRIRGAAELSQPAGFSTAAGTIVIVAIGWKRAKSPLKTKKQFGVSYRVSIRKFRGY
jgi:hypothetical protein